MPSDLMFKAMNRVHRLVLGVSGGRVGGKVSGMPVLELTTTGTGDEMLKWYVTVRPQCDELMKSLQTPEPFVEVVVNKEDSYTASVVARLETEEPLKRTANRIPGATISSLSTHKSIELPLEFTSEGMGGWKLDGKRTFEAIPKKP